MLSRYNIGEIVSPVDAVDLGHLLSRHNDLNQKIGCGVSHYKVDMDGYGGKCFWLVRSDGTEEDFTYVRCVTGIW
ncbi:DCL family protein [Dyella sp.]|uniref:DCL family protein n=1 Tax=Dyella sp. TaxID=1869338 RepID=UPI0039C8B8D6